MRILLAESVCRSWEADREASSEGRVDLTREATTRGDSARATIHTTMEETIPSIRADTTDSLKIHSFIIVKGLII